VSIVVLEFDPVERSTLMAALEGAGFQVAAVTPEDMAVDAVEAVIVGTMPPGDRAIALFRRLRASGYAGAIVAVGVDAETDGVAYLEQGADDFLRRPIRVTELVARIRAVLRRVTWHSRLELGPLTIDRSRRVALLRGKRLGLTAREYSLLVRLAEADGQTLTRADLQAAVWGSEGERNSNLVQVNLSRLRDKLGPDASLIETVRRGGYRLRR
jgi:two-component system, OmpR family, response regulator